MRAFTSSSGRTESSPKSMSTRASPRTYSAFRREKPSAVSSSSVAPATRSRVGNATASSAGSPKRSMKRLRRDRGDERLERIGRERRAKAVQPAHSLREDRIAVREGVERLEIELETE